MKVIKKASMVTTAVVRCVPLICREESLHNAALRASADRGFICIELFLRCTTAYQSPERRHETDIQAEHN